MFKTTPMTISLKRQSKFLYQNAPRDNSEFTEVLDKFTRGSVPQGTELLRSMRGLSRTRLAEQMRSERASHNRRSLQYGAILTVAEEGRHMIRQSDYDERAKAERLVKRLEEKDSKVGRCRSYNCTWMAEGREIEAIAYS
jgi:hypothetical protein